MNKVDRQKLELFDARFNKQKPIIKPKENK